MLLDGVLSFELKKSCKKTYMSYESNVIALEVLLFPSTFVTPKQNAYDSQKKTHRKLT